MANKVTINIKGGNNQVIPDVKEVEQHIYTEDGETIVINKFTVKSIMEYIKENLLSREELAKKVIEVADMQDEYKSAIRKGDKEEIRFMARVYYEERRKLISQARSILSYEERVRLISQAKSILFNGKPKD